MEKKSLHGWLAAGNLNIECLRMQYLREHPDSGVDNTIKLRAGEPVRPKNAMYWESGERGQYAGFANLLNKFPEDGLLFEDGSGIYFLDGYVYNKSEYIRDFAASWPEAFARAAAAGLPRTLQALRGGFCGYVLDKAAGSVAAYVDQVSVRALYYYADGDRWMLSNHIPYMVSVLQSNGIRYDFDETAAKYMLTYGYMIDDSTFIRQIRRVYPGSVIEIRDGAVQEASYYMIPNQEVQMTEEEAVERVDAAFRQAVDREFGKDREYGYRHLVDISGGLDSRMVTWVAHDMGYTDQLNLSYSKLGYADQKISGRVARRLGHEYIYKSLDDIGWMRDVDAIVRRNNGAALYSGITGGNQFLAALRTEDFGIEHTGMIGDAILSTFYHDRDFNYGKPQFGLHKHSERLSYEFDDAVTARYSCQEMFAIYTRGILGAQSSYLIRQQYAETASPFMDVDFLNTVFSLPFAYRVAHRIYLRWMKEKYPMATEFGWEKWGGVKPREDHILLRKIRTTQRLLRQFACNLLKTENTDSMNPLDYWFANSEETRRCLQNMFDDRIVCGVLDEKLSGDVRLMFEQGDFTEKSMALTVLSAAHLYFD